MKKILLIEDNADVRENTAEIMELANYKVFVAENGKTGVELALKERPDLIICDVMMPVLDGYGVLHLLNKNPDLSSIPFIFLTAKAERADMRKGMEMGADDYITKPFDDVELLNAIEIRLKKAEAFAKEMKNDAQGISDFYDLVRANNDLKALSFDRKANAFKKKQIIYSEGNQPMKLYFLVKGKVKTFRTSPDGKELITALYKDGDFFGYLSLLEDKDYTETAEAMEDSEIIMIPKEDFTSLLHHNPLVTHKFVKMLANSIEEKEKQLLGLAYNSLRRRVADALLELKRQTPGSDRPEFSIYISREDLANLVGTATESLIRTLSDFKADKLIDIRDGKIVFLNEQKLKTMYC